MKRKNKILTESQKRQIIQDKEKSILESFTKTFNKIKRIDENEIGGKPYSEQEFYLYSVMRMIGMKVVRYFTQNLKVTWNFYIETTL